jgi:hypothetical protein
VNPSTMNRRLRTRAAGAIVCAAGMALALAPAAQAAAPSATTHSAHAVSFGSATLRGTVNPNGQQTFYYFQYGVTKAYGSQTTPTTVGSGAAPVNVSVPISGLQPVTQYHFRIVAVNSVGQIDNGADRTFVTKPIPLSLAILAAPSPVPYGGTVVVQGTLSGTGNADRVVMLQADPFGSPLGFQPFGNPELTNSVGGFSFPVLGLTSTTAFRVVTATKPTVTSPVATAQVAVIVSAHIGRSSRRHRVRFFGTVTPAENGAQVGILREVRGRGIPVGGATLHPLGTTKSRFSTAVPARPGLYRVLVVVPAGPVISAYGQPLVIR